MCQKWQGSTTPHPPTQPGWPVLIHSIRTELPTLRVIDDGDMLLYRALPTSSRDAIGPFVFIDHYRSRTRRGIGDKPHPHAGIEVISYLLEGGMEHRDSMGFRDRLGPGDTQWIRAGKGVLHAEQPLSGRHGLQLWTSLPSAEKFAEPAYLSWRAQDIPCVALSGGLVRVIAGRVAGVEGPMSLSTPTTFAHVQLEPGATIRLPVDTSAEMGIYVLDGGIVIDQGTMLHASSLALLTNGSEIFLTGSGHRTDLAIIGGAPAERPILFSGPFVMDSVEHLALTRRNYLSGKMGRMEGVPF